MHKTIHKKSLALLATALLAFNVASAQDDCASAVTVADLTGTTCATSAPSATNFLGPGGCEEGVLDTWFQFTAQGPTANITVSNTANGWRPEFLVVSGTPASTCAGFTLESCNDQNGNYTSIAAATAGLTVGETYWIVVSSNNDNTNGTLSVCVDNPPPATGCLTNDDCTTPTTISLNPTGGAASCVTSCNTSASPGPDFAGNNCYDLPNPTVWYTFTTAANAATLDINLTSAAMSDPEFTLFTNSCGPFTIVNCVEGSAGAASASQVNVTSNTTYILAVSDATGDEGNFDLCLTQFSDNSACNVDNLLEVTGTSLGSAFTGPFQPGEVVTFCYTINSYLTASTNCNYLQGIVPTFGDCWDPVSFDAQGMPTSITTALTTVGVLDYDNPAPSCEGDPAGNWSWFPNGAVQYNLNSPNPMNHTLGSNVGAGWFFTTSYASPEGFCNTPETDPNSSYGDNDFIRCTDQSGWQVCFQLQVVDALACGLGQTDCNVTMKTYADGEIGVWSNIGCTADIPTSLPRTVVCALLSTDITAFTGVRRENSNWLSWSINQQLELDYFSIERSLDGMNWTQFGVLNGEQDQVNYTFEDKAPYNPITYYRLKMVDNDGNFTRSQIISVSSDKKITASLTSEIYPNPAKTAFYFNYTGNDFKTPLEIKVVNMVGQEVANYNINVASMNEKITLSAENLPDGLYSLTITQGAIKTTKRIRIAR